MVQSKKNSIFTSCKTAIYVELNIIIFFSIYFYCVYICSTVFSGFSVEYCILSLFSFYSIHAFCNLFSSIDYSFKRCFSTNHHPTPLVWKYKFKHCLFFSKNILKHSFSSTTRPFSDFMFFRMKQLSHAGITL